MKWEQVSNISSQGHYTPLMKKDPADIHPRGTSISCPETGQDWLLQSQYYNLGGDWTLWCLGSRISLNVLENPTSQEDETIS